MAQKHRYQPYYTNSSALVIGINSYPNAPLAGCVNDAKGVKAALITQLGFAEDRITELYDDAATKVAILDAFDELNGDEATEDDRLVVFFAGHGHTKPSPRLGDVGFLVPVDGDAGRLATLIRMDDLIRGAELLSQKHILFILDACFSGLAFRRSAFHTGSQRLMRDMMQRFSRQVIAAGKTDETVADGDGPRPGNSIFTGHLLEALEGSAAKNGIMTANNLMAYVYQAVSTDAHSEQTPHYGIIQGEGDMILVGPGLSDSPEVEGAETDLFIDVSPSSDIVMPVEQPPLIDLAKEYISDPRFRIKLDDLVTQEVRRFLASTGTDRFPLGTGKVDPKDFEQRLQQYEDITKNLQTLATVLAYWGEPEHRQLLGKLLDRMCDPIDSQGGLVVWIALRWYPVMLTVYSAGIAAIASEKYENLAQILKQPVRQRHNASATEALHIPLCEAILELERSNIFKTLPGSERLFVPRSEHLFKQLQPILDDSLFLGASYERHFDRFEVILALEHASQHDGGWGPYGRFGYKRGFRSGSDGPMNRLKHEADSAGSSWPPLKANLFRGDMDVFQRVWTEFEHTLGRLNWI